MIPLKLKVMKIASFTLYLFLIRYSMLTPRGALSKEMHPHINL